MNTKIIRLAALVVVAAGVLLPPTRAAAQFGLPSTTNHYAILPRLSVFNQSAGFGGFDVDFGMRGEFDFKIEQSPLAVFPPLYYAHFIEPKIEAFHPAYFGRIDVDETLNLAELTGGQRLQNPLRPNLFTFRGTIDDGSSIELNAIVRGPWLYLRGGTTPPAGSADFFKYDIRAVARRTPIADLNDDGMVDAADLRSWATSPAAEGGNFLEWQLQLGETPPSIDSLDAELNAALAGAASAVPEPSSLGLLAIAAAAFGAVRRRAGC